MTLRAKFVTLAMFATAGALAVGGAAWTVDAIERHGVTQVTAALGAAEDDWAQVSADGLQLEMRGTAPDEAARFRALGVAGGVVDSARVIDRMRVAAAETVEAPRFSIEMLRGEDGISLIGLIPAATNRQALLDAVARTAMDTPITDLLEVASYPQPDGWPTAVAYGLDALARLPRSKVSVAADRVAILSMADSRADKLRLENGLRDDAPDEIEVAIDISAPRPVITPFTTRFLIGPDGARFDACAATSAPDARRIEAAARAAGMAAEEGTCTVGLGAPTPDWTAGTLAGIEAVAAMGRGSVTFSDLDVTLAAPRGMAPGLFERHAGALQAALPAAFSLDAVLPEPAVDDPARADPGPPAFAATRSPEGDVQLRGRLADSRARAVVGNYARALFGVEQVTDGLRLDDGVPGGWSPRILAGLDALALLASGSVTVTQDAIAVAGTTGNPDARAEIARRLSAQLGTEATYDIAVRYDRRLDPVLGLPTPEECVARVNEVLEARKIVFAPGSGEIDADARSILDDIAAVLRTCEDTRMEIAGYTDSQGREVMNRELSQSRADAVLAAMGERRVAVSDLFARGYGEADPIGDNATEAGREANRRIEFRLIEADDGTQRPDSGSGVDDGDAGADAVGIGAGDASDNGPATAGDTAADDRAADSAAADGTAADGSTENDTAGDGTAADGTAADGATANDTEGDGASADGAAGDGAAPAAADEG